MENKKLKKNVPLELNDEELETVPGGTMVQDDVIVSGLISVDENVIVIDNHII